MSRKRRTPGRSEDPTMLEEQLQEGLEVPSQRSDLRDVDVDQRHRKEAAGGGKPVAEGANSPLTSLWKALPTEQPHRLRPGCAAPGIPERFSNADIHFRTALINGRAGRSVLDRIFSRPCPSVAAKSCFQMNIRQLEYFLTVAECKSMTLAATTLGVAQPTLTKTVRALELELGVKLFERMPRGVELTPFGHSLLRHAEAIRVQVGDARNEIDALRGGTYGTVVIGAGPAWLRRLLPQAVARAIEKNPSIRVHIEGGFDDALLRALRQGELDLVVAELPPAEAARGLKMVSLTSDRLGVCCRRGHELDGVRNLPLSQLLKYPWVMPPETTRAHQRLKALFIAADLSPPTAVVQTESMAFLLQMIRFFDALTLTVSTTLTLPEAADLVMLDVPELEAVRSAGIIRRKDGWLSPAAESVVQELVEICKWQPTN